MNYLSRRKLTYWLLALPALGFLGLQIWPLGYAVKSAVTNSAGHLTTAHFQQVFSDPLYWAAVRNNFIIPIASVAFETVIGVGMALWFYSIRKRKTFWRTVAIVPYAVPEIVYLLTMKLVFREHGYLNSLLLNLHGSTWIVDWFQPGRVLVMVVIIFIDAWRVTPVVFLIVLMALEQLSESFLEAARLDGATRWQLIRFIQIPLIVPALMVAIALRAVDAFRIFATPLVLLGVEALPVITSVAYHYKAEANNPAAANVTALSLAVLLFAGTLVTILFTAKKRDQR